MATAEGEPAKVGLEADQDPGDLLEQQDGRVDEVAGRKVKRKLAMVVGYIGTRYRGLQINYELEASSEKKSVEEVVRHALVRAGAITALNAQSLEKKVSWSRSSRTDAGVHALRLVLCAKFLVGADDIDEHGHCPALAHAVNTELPEDIRCYGAARVPNSFDAKNACSWREYEYLLPTHLARSAMDPIDIKPEDLAVRLEELMQHFQGCHSFHNFTRLKASDLQWREREPASNSSGGKQGRAKSKDDKGKGRGKKRKAQEAFIEAKDESALKSSDKTSGPAESDINVDASVNREDAPEEKDTSANSLADQVEQSHVSCMVKKLDGAPSAREPVEPVWVEIFGKDAETGAWKERSEQVMKHTQSTIHMCIVEPTLGGVLLRVRLRGQFFLYNQIRLMVGSALAISAGKLPKELVDMALTLQTEMHMPLAPPTGLLLRTAGFSEMDRRAGYCAMDNDQALDSMLPPGGFVLLSKQASEQAEVFTVKVEEEIEKQWRESGEAEAWTAKLMELRIPSESVLLEMRRATADRNAQEAEFRLSQATVDRRRREVELDRQSGSSFAGVMPRRFAAELMVRFRLLPGWRVTNVQHALAIKMRHWHVEPEKRPPRLAASWPPETKELLEYVAEVGADTLAEEGA